MNDTNQLIEKILKTLEENGIAQKKVALPLDKLTDASHKRKITLEQLMRDLKSKANINAEIRHEDNRIVFTNLDTAVSKEAQGTKNSDQTKGFPDFSQFNWDQIKDSSPEELAKMAQELAKQMTPEQMEQLKGAYANLSPQEKEELLKKAPPGFQGPA